jgi:hypothetical protein
MIKKELEEIIATWSNLLISLEPPQDISYIL